MMGSSTEPHVSAPQWTSPELKSAVMIPHSAAITMVLRFSIRKWMTIKKKFTIIKVIQIPTQIHSCVRLPEKKEKHISL